MVILLNLVKPAIHLCYMEQSILGEQRFFRRILLREEVDASEIVLVIHPVGLCVTYNR